MSDLISKDKAAEVHLANYRMAFDAMRAYHTSEIEHKKDVITILNSIFLSIITVFAGLAYFITTPTYDMYWGLTLFFIPVTAILYIVMIWRLRVKSDAKIASDNVRYEQFREECKQERVYLRLNTFFPENTTYWEEPSRTRAGTGFKVTQGIVGSYCWTLIGIVTCLSVFSFLLLIIKQCSCK